MPFKKLSLFFPRRKKDRREPIDVGSSPANSVRLDGPGGSSRPGTETGQGDHDAPLQPIEVGSPPRNSARLDGGDKRPGIETGQDDHGKKNTLGSAGFFANSDHPTFHNTTMIDNSGQIISSGKKDSEIINDLLKPEIMESATLGSNARYPPPCCHPGTREQLNRRLASWFVNKDRQWNILWLHGPAGVGKSAVAQTFGEHAESQGRLGAVFFFSRISNRDNPISVIPTLSYQLATQLPGYKSRLSQQLSTNPLVLTAALRVQFQKLLVEPLSILVKDSPATVVGPFLIILDGLDECKSEDAQREIIKLIGEVAHLETSLPLLWLICSRPEPHIKSMFSPPVLRAAFGKEELPLDAEAIKDVDLRLRDGFKEILERYQDTIVVDAGQPWPSNAEFAKISKSASGLFMVASTALKYIGDPDYGDPEQRLQHFLSFVDKSQKGGEKSPWETLDLLYTFILSDVPEHILPTTMKILGFIATMNARDTRTVCNFLHLKQGAFYTALRKLHAVIRVPLLEKADSAPPSFHHASFKDSLQDQTRSGQYFLAKEVLYDLVKCSLYWCQARSDPETIDYALQHIGYASCLTWSTPELPQQIFRLKVAVIQCLEKACQDAEKTGGSDVFIELQQCQFTNFVVMGGGWTNFLGFTDYLYRLCARKCLSDGYIRTEARGATDTQLLEYLALLAGPSIPLRPAYFPFSERQGWEDGVHYFFMGHGPNSCVICNTFTNSTHHLCLLRSGGPPSEKEISAFCKYMGI